MDSGKNEREADSVSDASSHDDNGRNRGVVEPNNKMNFGSFKLSRSPPSLRSCVRPMKSPPSKRPGVFSGYVASSEKSTPVEMSDSSSPSYSKATTSCSDARKETFQESSEGTDLKNLKKTRSIKPARPGSSRPSTEEEHSQCDTHDEDTTARYSKVRFRASPSYSESSYGDYYQNKERSNGVRPMPDSSVSAAKTTVTLGYHRILTNTASLKSKRSSMKTSLEVSETSELSIARLTCSSTLKNAKFPRGVELQPGGSEPERNSAMKVCTYSYCSLHGHSHGSHGNLPPLKQFISMRRHSLKTQKSIKAESCSIPKVKRSRSRRKGAETSPIIFNGDPTDQETAKVRRETSPLTERVFKAEFKGADSHGDKNMHIGDSRKVYGILMGETSNPDPRCKPKDSKQCDNPSLKHDSVVSTGPEEAPMDANVRNELNGDTVAHLKLEGFEGDSELNKKNSESNAVSRIINEEKPHSDQNNDFHEGFSQRGRSTANCTAAQPQKTRTGKQKHMGLWGLIYLHMASGIAIEEETSLPHNGKDKAEEAKARCSMPQMNDSVSCQCSSGTDEDMGVGDHNTGEQKFEPWESNAIKLVQEAFDKILSEIPDQSPDDQSITNEITSEQELLENNQPKGRQQSISNYCNCTKEGTAEDPEEPQLEAANINISEEEKASSKMGNKSRQNWSNLKKVIILERFVKVLQKVNKLNARMPPILPTEANPETKKVHLRHQTVEERKSADKWMLDYALRQVISKLDPAQKRKVALLVQAFETVTSLPEISSPLVSNAASSSHATPLQECDDDFTQRGDQNDSGSFHKTSYPEISIEHTTDQVSDFPAAEMHVPETCSEPQERTQTNLKEEENETVSFNLDNGETDYILRDDQLSFIDVSSTNPKEPRFSSKLDNSDKHETTKILNSAGEQSCQAKCLSPEIFAESTAVNSVVSSASISELLEESIAVCREASTKYEVLYKSSPLEESDPSDTIDMAQESKLEKYTRLWYLLYKHMVSGSTEAGTHPILEGARKEEQESGDNALLGKKDADSCKDLLQMNQKLTIDDQNVSCQKIECDQIEAIKIIEEAIDEIPLPDIQDDPPITGNMIPEWKLQKKRSEDGEVFTSTSTNSSKVTFTKSNNSEVENDKTLDYGETRLNSNDILAQEEPEAFSKLVNKSKPHVQKNWSNLKKVILIKRFIKSLEKVRKLNPREPRYLPLELAKNAKKVHLRHHSMEDRKNTEEWMFDHALQQVVAKLTPSRRRKVELLVKAFETVTPMMEVNAKQRHGAAVSPDPGLIGA